VIFDLFVHPKGVKLNEKKDKSFKWFNFQKRIGIKWSLNNKKKPLTGGFHLLRLSKIIVHLDSFNPANY